MAKVYDATLNSMIDQYPQKWVDLIGTLTGIAVGPATPVDSDLSATLQADRLFLIEGDEPYLLHVELETSAALGMPKRLLKYNAAASKDELEVLSIVILLHRQGNPSDLTGTLECQIAGQVVLTFHYKVIRLWELPLKFTLENGPALLPIAMLTDEAAANPTEAITRLAERLQEDVPERKMQEDTAGFCYFLLGLRYKQPWIFDLLQETLMFDLEESATYQLTLKKGEDRGALKYAKSYLLRQGTKRFGIPLESVSSRIEKESNLAKLEAALERVPTASSWEDIVEAL
jgi:hypothetical protein